MWVLMNKYRAIFQAACLCLLACVALLSAYSSGYAAAKHHYIAQIADIQHDHTAQRLRMEQQHRQAEQQWQRQAQIQSAELVKAQQAIDRQAEQLKQGNHHAIQQDNTLGNHNGIGTHSVRQYNRAFGYTD